VNDYESVKILHSGLRHAELQEAISLHQTVQGTHKAVMSYCKKSISPEQKRAMLLAIGLFIIILAAFAIWGYRHNKAHKLRFGRAELLPSSMGFLSS
jgi:hypothetical protein